MRRGALATLFLTMLIDLLGFGMVVPFLPRMARELGATDVEASLVMSGYSLMQLLFVPIWGRLSDRVGRKPVLLWSISATCVFMAALGFAETLWMLLAARIVSGVATANLSVVQACVADVTKPEERAKGMGLLGAAFGIGFVLGPFFGGHLAALKWLGRESTGPAFASAALALLNLVMALALLPETLPPERRGEPRVERANVLRPSSYLRAVRASHVTLPVLLNVVFVGSFAGLEFTFGLFALDAFDMNARGVGNVFGVMGVVGAIIQGGLIRKLAPRLGEVRLLRVGLVLLSTGFLLLVRTPHWGVAGLYAVTLVLATGHSVSVPSLSSYVSRRAPATAQGATLGLLQSSGSLGRLVGPVTAGALYGHVSHVAPYLLSSVGMAVAAVISTRLAPVVAVDAGAPDAGG
ncbi:MAG: MFS transporter [Polyangiaceae bacterium]|nr:MFS transporter [Polyangiaceae bacterium]